MIVMGIIINILFLLLGLIFGSIYKHQLPWNRKELSSRYAVMEERARKAEARVIYLREKLKVKEEVQ